MSPKVGWTVKAGIALVTLALNATPARGETELLGPLRIRDMTPFNLLRLDMLPAHAVAAGTGSWGIEADVSFSNTFVMSENVKDYLEGRGGRSALAEADANAILALGEEAYYVDGEFGLLDLTFHYGLTRRSSVYLTLSACDFSGGFLDGTIENFHDTFGLPTDGRDRVARDRFQAVLSLEGVRQSFLDAPVAGGLGDPVVGARHVLALRGSRWGLVLDGAAKFALRGERLFLSTGTDDFGLQVSLQGKFRRQGVFFSTSVVRTDGRVLGVHLRRRAVPTLTAAYEFGVTRNTSVVVQFYASESTVRDTAIAELRADKFQASLGLRGRRGRLVYGFAVTENVANFENTPDVGASLTLAFIASKH